MNTSSPDLLALLAQYAAGKIGVDALRDRLLVTELQDVAGALFSALSTLPDSRTMLE